MEVKNWSIKVTPELNNRVLAASLLKSISSSALVRLAVTEWLEKNVPAEKIPVDG